MLVEDRNKRLQISDLGLVDLEDLLGSTKAKIMCRSITSGFYINNGQNELEQAALIGMTKAFRDYDPSTGVSFWGFAEVCVRRQVITELKTSKRLKHSPLNDSTSLNASPGTDSLDDDQTLEELIVDYNSHDPLDELIAQESLWGAVENLEIAARLTELEKLSYKYIEIYGLSYEDAAQRISDHSNICIESKTIDNAMQRARRKVKEASPPAVLNC